MPIEGRRADESHDGGAAAGVQGAGDLRRGMAGSAKEPGVDQGKLAGGELKGDEFGPEVVVSAPGARQARQDQLELGGKGAQDDAVSRTGNERPPQPAVAPEVLERPRG
jgi:hypothetical protein